MNNIIKLLSIFILTTSSLAVAAPAVTRAQAVLSPTKDNHVTGTVTFYQFADGVKVVADVNGLQPGKHGFHIHEWGDCSAADASSAGGHFNPSHEQHGAPDAPHHHVGDLGNIVADANGKAHYEEASKDIHLNGADSIIGHSVIVHTGADDLHTQPTGNSGGRVACGVIGVINPFPEKG
jgi:Cu-Zn family superoxide dismutase